MGKVFFGGGLDARPFHVTAGGTALLADLVRVTTEYIVDGGLLFDSKKGNSRVEELYDVTETGLVLTGGV